MSKGIVEKYTWPRGIKIERNKTQQQNLILGQFTAADSSRINYLAKMIFCHDSPTEQEWICAPVHGTNLRRGDQIHQEICSPGPNFSGNLVPGAVGTNVPLDRILWSRSNGQFYPWDKMFADK